VSIDEVNDENKEEITAFVVKDTFGAGGTPPTLLREMSASRIALIIVSGFFLLLGLPFVYLFLGVQPADATATKIAEVIDLIKTVAAVLSGIVGSVLGYYFRVKMQEEETTSETSS
jgi:hypothetical protein